MCCTDLLPLTDKTYSTLSEQGVSPFYLGSIAVFLQDDLVESCWVKSVAGHSWSDIGPQVVCIKVNESRPSLDGLWWTERLETFSVVFSQLEGCPG